MPLNDQARTSVRARHGVTLIETLVGIGVFVIIAGGLYSTYIQLVKLAKAARVRTAATALANQYVEVARNLPYTDVGVVSGVPSGVLPVSQILLRDGTSFTVRYFVRNIDDEFDGTIGGSPNDLSPADYKLVTVEVTCNDCAEATPVIRASTHVAPKGLETASTNGALFVQVIDANGQPVANANVHIANDVLIPPVVIDDVTNATGWLQIVDVPPAVESYRIEVSKTGYSSDRTYAPDDPLVENPVKLDATVVIQQVTQITFAIDQVSTVDFASTNTTCTAVSNIPFDLKGVKLIGQSPDVLKYESSQSTGFDGLLSLAGLEWDSYTPTITSLSYDLRGTIPLLPLNLAPDTTQDMKLVMESKLPQALLVIVRDVGTQLPLSDASVHLTATGYDQTGLTSQGHLRQTDWSGGSGQTDLVDPAMYFADDGLIDTANPTGEIKLKDFSGTYAAAAELESSSFDTGTSSNFASLTWQPGDQPAQTGTDPVRFQIATNNDNTTWNFLGPDGTDQTYYNTSGQTLSSAHNGDRYLRYKLFLSTADTQYTPNISEVSITFGSSCVPPGQAFFNGLANDTYDLEVSLSGYQTSTTQVSVASPWQSVEIGLIPN